LVEYYRERGRDDARERPTVKKKRPNYGRGDLDSHEVKNQMGIRPGRTMRKGEGVAMGSVSSINRAIKRETFESAERGNVTSGGAGGTRASLGQPELQEPPKKGTKVLSMSDAHKDRTPQGGRGKKCRTNVSASQRLVSCSGHQKGGLGTLET